MKAEVIRDHMLDKVGNTKSAQNPVLPIHKKVLIVLLKSIGKIVLLQIF